MAFFDNAMYALQRFGVQDVLLPFALIFTICYAVLGTIPLFAKKAYATTISLVIALAVIFPHVTGGNYGYYGISVDVVNVINQSLPSVGLILVMVLSLMIVMGALGLTGPLSATLYGGIFSIVSLLLVFYTFGSSAGWFDSNMFSWLDQDIQALLLIIAIFYLFISFITEPEPNKDNPSKPMMKSIKEFVQELLKP